MKKLLYIFLILPFLIGSTYYVASDGDFKNTSQVNSAMGTFLPGDNVYFKGSENWVFDGINNVTLEITAKGNVSNYITFGSYGGSNAVFDGDGVYDEAIHLSDSSGNFYVKIENIEVKNFNLDGIGIGDAKFGVPFNVVIDSCYIHNITVNRGIHIQSSDVIVNDTEIAYVGSEGIGGDGNNWTIGYCNIHDIDQADALGDAIQLYTNYANNNWYIHHNILSNPNLNKGCFIAGDDGTNTNGGIFEYNNCSGGLWGFVSHVPGSICRYNLMTQPSGQGINIGDSDESYYYNNIIYDSDEFIRSRGSYGITAYVYHNTGINITGYGIDMDIGNQTIYYKNNICYLGVGGESMNIGNTTTLISDYNIFYPEKDFIYNGTTYNSLSAYQLATGQDLHSIASDPLLASNYRPLVGSPAINAGVDVGVDTDYLGNTRIGAPDMGCFESGNFIKNATLRNCTLN